MRTGAEFTFAPIVQLQHSGTGKKKSSRFVVKCIHIHIHESCEKSSKLYYIYKYVYHISLNDAYMHIN